MVEATIIWLHAFATWPEPSGPRWTGLPHAVSTADASATSRSSPPTMIDSVPASAPSTPPDTGASTTRTAPAVVSANRSTEFGDPDRG